MDTIHITSAWTDIVQYFFPVFTAPTARIFLNLVTGWILCTTRKTITRILPLADPQSIHAHDAYHRFFPDAVWASSQLWKHLAILLVRIFCPRGIILLDVDDTVFHRTGKKVNGAGWWRDAVRSTTSQVVYAWGLNLVIVTLRIHPPWKGPPIGLPINMRVHRKNGPTLIELAEQMLQEVTQWFPERRFRVHCDGFYAPLAGCGIGRTDIISRMRRDANIYELPAKRRTKKRGRPRKRGKKLGCPQHISRHVGSWKKVKVYERGTAKKRLLYSRIVSWYRVRQKPVLLVISRDPKGKEKDSFFFTTDITMQPKELLESYSGRWCIEETIKQTKQVLGGHQLQTHKRIGPERAAMVSLWLYSTVWLWFLSQRKSCRLMLTVPWYSRKSHPSFADAICCLRRRLWRDRIKMMFEKHIAHDKNTEFLVEALSSAA